MPKSPHQKLKLLYLYRILLERTDEAHKMTTDELISALQLHGIEAERKSIYDDIAALQEFGLDVILQRGRNGGYYVGARQFELPELKLLVDAVQCSRFITEKKSHELIRKVAELTSAAQAQELQRQVYVSGRTKTMNESIYYTIDNLHTALSVGKQITFQYFEWTLAFGSSTSIQKQYRHGGQRYRLSPWALLWEDENYYLVGYNSDLDEIRHFRVDKMDHIVILDMPREGQHRFDRHFNAMDYSRKTFGMFSGEEKQVRLKCDNTIVGVLRDRFGSDLMVQPLDDAHFSATVDVVVSAQFYSWIFGLGGQVQIMEPAEVRDAFQRKLQAMLIQ